MNFSTLPNTSILGRLVRKPLKLIPSEMAMPILQGPLIGKRWLAGSHTHGCWLGCYEPQIQRRFTQEITPGQVVFDIGANAGFYSMLASVLVGHTGSIYSFEPLPRNVAFLKRHVQINRLKNVTVLEAAASDVDGESNFDDTSGAATGHFSENGKLRVKCVTIDSLVSAAFVRVPDCLKIDVEGAEVLVLAGSKSVLEKFRPKIFLSTHGGEAKRECRELLRLLGYEWERLSGTVQAECDEFFARPI